MKKKALMKLLAVSIAATMMFTGCEKADPATSGTGTTTESSVESNTTTETAKTSETTETAKTTESTAAESTEKTANVGEIEELDKTMYSSKLVNVREEPNERAARVSSLKKGAEVHVTGLCDNGWYRVDLGDGKVAYCPDGYLVDSLE